MQSDENTGTVIDVRAEDPSDWHEAPEDVPVYEGVEPIVLSDVERLS